MVLLFEDFRGKQNILEGNEKGEKVVRNENKTGGERWIICSLEAMGNKKGWQVQILTEQF